MGNMSDLGGIFEDDENGRSTGDIHEVLDHMTARIQAGELNVGECLEGLLNLMTPGRTENSHDVLREFRTAMAVQGFMPVAKNVQGLWLTIFPWGMGFHLGFEHDYPVKAISHDAKQAIVKSLCAILVQGDVNASISPNGRITITSDEGDEHEVNVAGMVRQFNDEMEKELGPSAVEQPGDTTTGDAITDWMKRWMS